MATYYVSNTGTTGTGSSSSPFTIAQAEAFAFSAGDTIVLMGGEWAGITFTGLPSQVTIRGNGVSLSGAIGTLGSDWTQKTLNTNYTYAVSGYTPVGVTENYGSLTTPAKSHHIARKTGHYVRTTSEAAMEALPGSWYWNSGAGTLHINPLNTPPSGGSTAFEILRDGNVLTIEETQDFTIRDLETDRWVDTNGQVGYSVRLIGCQRGLIKNITAWDSGFHTFGGLGSAGNNSVSQDLTWENCHAYGMADPSFGAASTTINPFVCAATNSADADARQTNIRWSNCSVHAYCLLDENGNPIYNWDVINPGYTLIGFQTHDSTARCRNATIENCTIVADYDGVVWRAPNLHGLATDIPPTSLLDGPYHNQVIDSIFYVNPSSFSGNRAFNTLNPNVYHLRCQLYIQDDGTWASSCVAASFVDQDEYGLFDFCVFSGPLLGNAANNRWFNVADLSTGSTAGALGLRGCTFITSGATLTGNRGAMATLGSSGTIYMRNVLSTGTGNRIGFKSVTSGAAKASQFDVAGFNPYFIATGSLCVLGSSTGGDACITLADWQANIDDTVLAVNPLLTGYIPSASSGIYNDSNKQVDANLTNTLALDNTVYIGIVGAYQLLGGGSRKNKGCCPPILYIEEDEDETELQGKNIQKVRGV